MVSIDLTKEEIDVLIQMMEGATIPLKEAEKGLALLNKFKIAKV